MNQDWRTGMHAFPIHDQVFTVLKEFRKSFYAKGLELFPCLTGLQRNTCVSTVIASASADK